MQNNNTTEETFEGWCIVELMGHNKIAGYCSEKSVAGGNMLRVDVPETDRLTAFTRFYNHSAIYCIHPVDENTARKAVFEYQQIPVNRWDFEESVKKSTKYLTEKMSEVETDDEIPPPDWDEDDD